MEPTAGFEPATCWTNEELEAARALSERINRCLEQEAQ
jgi:hypothetical protein